MQLGRILLVVAAAMGAVSLLLPYFSADALGDVPGSAAGGPLPLAALVGAAVVAIAGDRGESLGGLPAIAAAATVAAANLLTGALLIDGLLAAREARTVGAAGFIGSGLWILIGAALLGIAGVIVGMSRRLR